MIFIFILGVIAGVAIGRAYGWMKYHYPESQEMIRVKIAKQRLSRLEYEEQEEKIRARIDASLNRRIGQ